MTMFHDSVILRKVCFAMPSICLYIPSYNWRKIQIDMNKWLNRATTDKKSSAENPVPSSSTSESECTNERGKQKEREQNSARSEPRKSTAFASTTTTTLTATANQVPPARCDTSHYCQHDRQKKPNTKRRASTTKHKAPQKTNLTQPLISIRSKIFFPSVNRFPFLSLIDIVFPVVPPFNSLIYKNMFLIPEIPDDIPENPLSRIESLPEISSLTTEKCVAAIGKHTLDYESGVRQIEEKLKASGSPPQLFPNVLDPLEVLGAPLDTTWGLVKTLYLTNSKLMPTNCYMGIHDRARRARATKFNSLPIYTACKESSVLKDGTYSEEQNRVVSKFLLEGRLNGVELKVCISFSTQPSRGPWTVTLQPHIYSQFLEFCGDRDLRKCQAQLLGFESFADMSMQTKMAGSVQAAQSMMNSLLNRGTTTKSAQQKELELLEDFAAERGFEGSLKSWDVPYWKRKQQRTIYSYDEEELREYFPFPQVLSGLFSLCENLFGLTIVPQSGVDTWHPDVQYYHISEEGKDTPIAGFYLDPYERLYEPSTLANISSHYESGKPLPDDIVDKLCRVRQHLAGYDLCQELYLSALDLELHTTKEFWLDIVRRLLPQYSSFPLEKIDSHPCAFLPIFTGQWGAAYYCHLWARIVAADAFSAFREVDHRNSAEISEIGKRFRNTILASGGGCHPSKVFRLFRGRDPSPNALLYTLGLKGKQSLIH
uniref:Peptidase M3A/M3B catalytic domain-containing protein n=1 Tax=Timema genevievae TaxID=629358 RepID=A0A7R9PKV2_TIMGE|nr:unnamed protein product [Timema genevievae]